MISKLFIDSETKDENEKKNVVIIDGSNVMRIGKNEANFVRLQLALKFCFENNYEPIHVLCDASLRHLLKDPQERETFEQMLKHKMERIKFQQTPAATEADTFILKLAVKYDEGGHQVRIMTNDLFKQFKIPGGPNYEPEYEKLLKPNKKILLKFIFMEGPDGMQFYEE